MVGSGDNGFGNDDGGWKVAASAGPHGYRLGKAVAFAGLN